MRRRAVRPGHSRARAIRHVEYRIHPTVQVRNYAGKDREDARCETRRELDQLFRNLVTFSPLLEYRHGGELVELHYLCRI